MALKPQQEHLERYNALTYSLNALLHDQEREPGLAYDEHHNEAVLIIESKIAVYHETFDMDVDKQ